MEEFKAQVYKARSFDRPSPFVRSVDLQTSRYDWLWNAVDRLTIGCGMSILFTPRTHTECAARRRMRLTDQFSCPGLFFSFLDDMLALGVQPGCPSVPTALCSSKWAFVLLCYIFLRSDRATVIEKPTSGE